MPWSPQDAQGHNKNANTKKKRKQWASVANRVLQDTGDEGRAVRIANDAIKRSMNDIIKSLWLMQLHE